MTERDLAFRLLDALARSELEVVEPLCAEDVVVFGTEANEVWHDRLGLLSVLDGMRDLELRARWIGEPAAGPGWVAGPAEFTFKDGSMLPVRVSMIFAHGRLVHAHYSVAAA